MSLNSSTAFIPPRQIRHQFSCAMSAMYQEEVPLYGELMALVQEVNNSVLMSDPDLKKQLQHTGELERLNMERHGAIRLGTAQELATMRRLFAVMGMYPVGYYDLVSAGVPVHSTAFRAVDSQGLKQSPFRVFTSLLRLELIEDEHLRQSAQSALADRRIFTDRVLQLIDQHEQQNGLTLSEAQEFVQEALQTFCWHDTSPISKTLYDQLLAQHRLIADVVGFHGPHINHLTPRTLDIDRIQQSMGERGIDPKAIIEGPPRRRCPILLRQTSFKALNEAVQFTNEDGSVHQGKHTARFGEIEQRGAALTPKGRLMYDKRLAQARSALSEAPNEDNKHLYYQLLHDAFADFPDDYLTLFKQGLAYFYIQRIDDSHSTKQALKDLAWVVNKTISTNWDQNLRDRLLALVNQGILRLEPIVYEDFLPVSAAGIFQSNLGDDSQGNYHAQSNQQRFEQDLGAQVYDEFDLYQQAQHQSLLSIITPSSIKPKVS